MSGSWAYYNDIDPFVCEWLRNLIAAGEITAGEVDERPIEEVRADDLRGFSRCHFFAGIAGWDLALKWAEWSPGRPVWTGSVPCQPLSSAGQRKGHADERHLWPAFHRLIAECRPPVVVGEQVASALGREWLAGVRADLEHLGYACGAADLPAACVGAPHIRQRLWWVANADGRRRKAVRGGMEELERVRPHGPAGGLADTEGERRRVDISSDERATSREVNASPNSDEDGRGLGDSDREGSQGWSQRPDEYADQRAPWATGEFIPCADGTARRTQPGIFPLADGVPGRVGRLRALGNAIVPQVGAVFVRAFLDAEAAQPVEP